MLIGEYTHVIDDKSRVSLPAKFRKELGGRVVITRGLDSCLFLYSEKAWEKIAEAYGSLSVASSDTRKFSRFMLAGASEVEVDSAGRILIPEFLADYAGLAGKVVLAGLYGRIEIWNNERWEADKSSFETQGESVAERLADLGMV
jgi:MraZ protein